MNGSLQKIFVNKIKQKEFVPTIFGIDNKYFTHGIIADIQKMV